MGGKASILKDERKTIYDLTGEMISIISNLVYVFGEKAVYLAAR
jgi:hypothetical protein